jgi:hypothetical protein
MSFIKTTHAPHLGGEGHASQFGNLCFKALDILKRCCVSRMPDVPTDTCEKVDTIAQYTALGSIPKLKYGKISDFF